MAVHSDEDLTIILHSFRDNLRMDKLEFDHALREFLSTRRPQTPGHAESPQSNSEYPDETTPEMLLDRRRNANNRQYLGRGKLPTEEAPKYGLPGMGQYEEKQKKYKAQLRDEYRSYMREKNAVQTRRQLGNNREDRALNYDELLAKKREEERNYRNRNEGFSNGGVRANSDGYLNRMPMSDQNYGMRPPVDVHPEVEEVTSMMNRIQRYNDELALGDDEDVRYGHGAYAETSERPHSYPHDAYLTPNFQHNGHSTEQDGRRRSDSPKFVTLDHPPPRANIEQGGGTNTYLNDLDNQVEESRRRRQNERAEQLRYERKLEEDNKVYDPWGRGGAGAPMRDRDGNVIASRKQLANGGERKSRPPPSDFTDANNRKKSDAQDAVPNYAIPRSPLPGQSSKYEGRKTNYDTYQDDLKRQIEDKKRRDREEKEKERLEEERLMQKIEEENEKMKRDHEDELQKQRLREDERRRRNEELQRRQEEQRKAAEMQKRDKKFKRRQEQLDERTVSLPRQESKLEDVGIKSPPLPGRKCKVVAAAAATNKPTIAAHSARGILAPAEKHGSSKDHILSQLSTMRQQLEKEQQLMQKQLKREMGSGYEVYDRKANEPTNERNRAASDDRNKPLIYRPPTPPPQPKSLVKKLPSAVIYNLPVYKDFVDDAQVTVPTEAKTAVAPVVKSRTLWPAMAMAIRATDGLKPLQGESLFLGVDGYETSGPGAGVHGRQADWQRDPLMQHDTSDDYQYNIDQLASHDAARRRYLSTLKNDPDEIKEDSFLDEFLAKNLQRR